MVAATNSSFLRGAAHPAEMVAGGVGVSSSRAARRAARKERASVQLGGGAARGARAGRHGALLLEQLGQLLHHRAAELLGVDDGDRAAVVAGHVVADADGQQRSEEHTSELQSLMRISYAVFCLQKKKHIIQKKNLMLKEIQKKKVPQL